MVADWAAEDAIEIRDLGIKGRGIVAKRDIMPFEVLIVQRARVLSISKEWSLIDHNFQSKMFNTGGQTGLKQLILSRSAVDMPLASVLSKLDSGKGKKMDLPSLEDLMLRFHPGVLPLLPQMPEYVRDTPTITNAIAEGVVDINCHGSASGELPGSQLYPLISLINHDKNANCAWWPLDPTSTIVISGPYMIQKNAEITAQYMPDEDKVQKKWFNG